MKFKFVFFFVSSSSVDEKYLFIYLNKKTYIFCIFLVNLSIFYGNFVAKIMRIHADPDPQHWFKCFSRIDWIDDVDTNLINDTGKNPSHTFLSSLSFLQHQVH